MRAWNTIVVGVRFEGPEGALGPGSRAALVRGLALGEAFGARVRCLTAVARNPEDEHEPGGPVGETHRAALAALARESGSDVPELEQADGAPHEALAALGRSGSADLVVVARHEDRDAGRLQMGSVARRVVHACRVPVWVEHPGLPAGPVLAATDLTPVGDLACRAGARLAQALGRDLHVLHAWQRDLAFSFGTRLADDAEVRARVQAVEDDARRRIHGVPDLADLGERLHVRVGEGAPSRAIVGHARGLSAEVCVVGSISRVGLPGLLLGSTALKLLDRLPCSMLAVHGT